MKRLVMGLLLMFGGAAQANTEMPWSEHAIDAAVVVQAQNHLNDIDTIKANFTQIAPSGSITSGRFYMERPGKMLWQYNPPVPVKMISRGSFLRYIDYELEQVSDIPIKGTLAGFLAQKDMDFHDKTIKILRAYERDGVVLVHVTQRDEPDEGELTFEFEAKPLKLRNIILKDAKGDETNISLTDAEYNLALGDALFKMEDPRVTTWRKNRR